MELAGNYYGAFVIDKKRDARRGESLEEKMMEMPNLSALAQDNVSDLLLRIIAFTRARHDLLCENVRGIRKRGFLPRDLQVEEFADLMSRAVEEHVASERLVLCDSESIRFGRNGVFEAEAVIDEHARDLFNTDIEKYLQHQTGKLRENMLNQKIASELLRQAALVRAAVAG